MNVRWALLVSLLCALALRLPPMLANRFHPDEALYGYWGLLIALGKDPLLASVPIYKPPLLPYLIAGTQGLLSKSEFAVRLPGLMAGILTVPLTAALTHALYRDRWAAVASATCVALSPFAILFSATAFTDPPMVALGLGACLAAARNRPGWAGLLAGLSFATKQTGLAWLPLTALLSIHSLRSFDSEPPTRAQDKPPISSLGRPNSARSGSPRPDPRRGFDNPLGAILDSPSLKSLSWLAIAFAAVFGATLIWDAARMVQGAEGFWSLGVTGYGGLRFIWPQELWPRLRGWADLGRYLFVSPVVNAALLLGLPVLTWRAFRRPAARGGAIDLLLVSFFLVYSLLHWLWAFPIWDRYLLPLLPILAILLGRITSMTFHVVQRFIRYPLFVICDLSFVILLAFPAWNAAAHSLYPVGGDHGAYDGIDQVAAFLNAQPEGTVVYQHWLGWEYAYYLFDGPISLAYWPTPVWLARDVGAFGAQSPRYIAFPAWESSARVERALAEAGYGLNPVLTTARRDGVPTFTVYRIRLLSNQ
jgi:hypothetical protein